AVLTPLVASLLLRSDSDKAQASVAAVSKAAAVTTWGSLKNDMHILLKMKPRTVAAGLKEQSVRRRRQRNAVSPAKNLSVTLPHPPSAAYRCEPAGNSQSAECRCH